MRKRESDEERAASPWFWAEAALVTVIVLGGCLAAGWMALTWIVDRVA